MESQWPHLKKKLFLSHDELENLLKPIFPDKILKSVNPISDGLCNTNIKFTFIDDAKDYLLRIYTYDPLTAKKELTVLKQLQNKVPIPKVLYADLSCQKLSHPYCIQSWLDGFGLSQVLTNCQKDELYQIVESLLQAHHQLDQMTFSHCGSLDSNFKLTSSYSKFSDFYFDWIEESFELRNPNFQISQKFAKTFLKTLKQYSFLLEPLQNEFSLIHCDWKGNNILLNQSNNWQVSGILDWEFAASGPKLYDWAILLRERHTNSQIKTLSEILFQSDLKKETSYPLDQTLRYLDVMNLCGFLREKTVNSAFRDDLQELLQLTITTLNQMLENGNK